MQEAKEPPWPQHPNTLIRPSRSTHCPYLTHSAPPVVPAPPPHSPTSSDSRLSSKRWSVAISADSTGRKSLPFAYHRRRTLATHSRWQKTIGKACGGSSIPLVVLDAGRVGVSPPLRYSISIYMLAIQYPGRDPEWMTSGMDNVRRRGNKREKFNKKLRIHYS